MAQHANSSNIAASADDLASSEEESSAMVGAQVFGYILSIFGWFIFGIYCSDAKSEAAGNCLIIASYFLAPVWLLLRFGAGLFPFSQKFAKSVEVPLS